MDLIYTWEYCRKGKIVGVVEKAEEYFTQLGLVKTDEYLKKGWVNPPTVYQHPTNPYGKGQTRYTYEPIEKLEIKKRKKQIKGEIRG